VISPESRPRLAAKARVRLDPRSGKQVLLYPERGLVLDETAAEIVGLCRGEKTVAAIVDDLAARHGQEARDRIEADVLGFLRALEDRGLLAP
jgi:coenzyme PQQ biosynthesis protein PqqD